MITTKLLTIYGGIQAPIDMFTHFPRAGLPVFGNRPNIYYVHPRPVVFIKIHKKAPFPKRAF